MMSPVRAGSARRSPGKLCMKKYHLYTRSALAGPTSLERGCSHLDWMFGVIPASHPCHKALLFKTCLLGGLAKAFVDDFEQENVFLFWYQIE